MAKRSVYSLFTECCDQVAMKCKLSVLSTFNITGDTIMAKTVTRKLDGLPDEEELQEEIRLAELSDELDNDPIYQQEIEEERKLRDQIAQYMGETGAKLYIYDMDEGGKNGSGVFIEKLVLEDFNHDEIMERLRDVHYGGDFKLTIRNKNGHIQTTQMVSTVKVEKPDPGKKDTDIAGIITAVKEGNNGNSEMLQMMMQQNQQNMQMMMQQQSQQAQTMAAMIQAIASRPEPQQQTFGPQEMIAIMTGLQSMQPKQPDSMELFLKGAEFGQNSGGGGDENVLQTAIKTLGGPIAALSQANAGAPVTQPVPQPIQQPPQQHGSAPGNPPTNEPAPAQPNGTEDMNLMQLMKLKPQLDMLIGAASQGKDPSLYAELLWDQLGPQMAVNLIGDEMYEKLFQYVPAAQPFRPWFDQLRAIVIQWVTEAQQSQEATNNASTETGGTVSDTAADTPQDQDANDAPA